MPIFAREPGSRYTDEAVYLDSRPTRSSQERRRREKLYRDWWIAHYRKGRSWAEIAREYRRNPDAVRRAAERWYESAKNDWVPLLHPLVGCRAWPVSFAEAAATLDPRPGMGGTPLYRCPVCSGLVIDRDDTIETWQPGVRPQDDFVCCVCDSANATNNAKLAYQRHLAEQTAQRERANWYATAQPDDSTDPKRPEALAC